MRDDALCVEDQPAPEDIQAVRDGLAAYNLAQTGDSFYTELAVFTRGADGTILGGVFGEVRWGWMYVDLVWLHEDLRGQGLGCRMMAALEQGAVARGIRNVYLATTGFQAPQFYPAIGYQQWGLLHNRPPGYPYLYFKKERIAPQPVDFGLTVVENPPPEDVRTVGMGLYQHNLAHYGPSGSRPLGIFLRDRNSCVRGGLFGRTYWGWFDLHFMWIDKALRGQGCGARMLALAEQECAARGTPSIVADTTSFQALPFFLKHGFEIFGTLDNRPPGHTTYFLKKEQQPSAP